MRAINLLPNASVVARNPLPSWLPFAAAGIVPFIALNLIFIGYTNATNAVKAQSGALVIAQANVAKLAPATAAAAPDTSILVGARTARLAAVSDVLAKEIDWQATVTDIARVLPARVWLTGMQLQSPSPADVATVAAAPTTTTSTDTTTTTTTTTPVLPPAASTGFTLNGYAYTADDVAAALERLQLLPTLSNVTLGLTQVATIGKKSVVQFTITAGLAPTRVVKP